MLRLIRIVFIAVFLAGIVTKSFCQSDFRPQIDSTEYKRKVYAYLGSINKSIQESLTANDTVRAGQLITKGIETTKRLLNSKDVLVGFFLLTKGELLVKNRRPDFAIPVLDSAAKIYSLYPQDRAGIAVLSNLGHAYISIFQLDSAESVFLRVERIVNKRQIKQNEEPFLANIYGGLSTVYRRLYDLKKAIFYQRKAVNLSRKYNAPNYVGNATDLITLLMADKQTKEGKTWIGELKNIIRDQHNNHHPALSYLLAFEAHIYAEDNDFDKAEAAHIAALQISISEEGENSTKVAVCHSELGTFYQIKKKDYLKAEYHRSEGLRILRHPANSIMRFKEALASSLNDNASINVRLKKFDQVAPLLSEAQQLIQEIQYRNFGFISERQKADYTKYQSLIFENTVAFTSHILRYKTDTLLQQISYNATLHLNSLLLDDARQIRNVVLKSGDSTLIRLHSTLLSLREKYNFVSLSQQDAYEEEMEALEQQVARRSATFRELRARTQTKWQQIEQKLLPGEASIAFVRFDAFQDPADTCACNEVLYAALVIRRGYTYPRFVRLGTEEQLMQLLKQSQTPVELYAGRRGTPRIGSMTYGDSLYRFIWQPIKTLLQGVHTVFYSPDGLLHQVAFAAIPVPATTGSTPKTELFLGKQYSLNQLFSTRQVAQGIRPLRWQPQHSAVVMGGIAYDLPDTATPSGKATADPEPSGLRTYFDKAGIVPFEPLASTEQEAIDVCGLLPKSKRFLGPLATEDALKRFSGRSPVILHVATHGFFIPDSVATDSTKNSLDPLFRSGLALAGANRMWNSTVPMGAEDGILTAYEVANLDLSQTRLVVLSACETALGDLRGPEGVFGLQRSFRLAGAEKLLMSLWPVDDDPTRQLMKSFYTYLKSGQEVRTAFRMAQRAIQKQFPDPTIWAAFVLIE